MTQPADVELGLVAATVVKDGDETGRRGDVAAGVEQLRTVLAATPSGETMSAAVSVAFSVSSSASILGRSAAHASSPESEAMTANSRAPNPVVARSAAVGVRARCFRTSLSRLVAIVWDGFRPSAVRSATTASSQLRCSRWQRPRRVQAEMSLGGEFGDGGVDAAGFFAEVALFDELERAALELCESHVHLPSALCPLLSALNEKGPTSSGHRALGITAGSDLLSHTVSHAVPSAVSGLTSVFGMGTGVTLIL